MERELYPNIEPHESHAQLLVQTDPSSSQFETAKQIIESTGIRILEIDQVSPAWMLLRLNTPDMREIALRLTQMGFFNFRGINALSLKG